MIASLAGAKAITSASRFKEGRFAGAAASMRASKRHTRRSANEPFTMA
jgi:hypothetical protein